jgi:hypothetical protein
MERPRPIIEGENREYITMEDAYQTAANEAGKHLRHLREVAYQTALELAEKCLRDKVVYSTHNIEEFLLQENYRGPVGDVVAGSIAEEVIARLLDEGRIYTGGDADSYHANVRSKGYVSCDEHCIVETMRAHPEADIGTLTRGGTEFPVDEMGKYVIS